MAFSRPCTFSTYSNHYNITTLQHYNSDKLQKKVYPKQIALPGPRMLSKYSNHYNLVMLKKLELPQKVAFSGPKMCNLYCNNENRS